MKNSKWSNIVGQLKNQEELIRLANKEFARMSKTNKRIHICQDSLNQINAGIFVPTTGIYVKDVGTAETAKELQKNLLCGDFESCDACAMGSLLLSGIRCMDSIEPFVVEEIWGDEIRDYFEDIFDRHNLELVECAFECDDEFVNIDDYPQYTIEDESGFEVIKKNCLLDRAIKFGEQYNSDKNRLIAILKNMIKNKGVFKP